MRIFVLVLSLVMAGCGTDKKPAISFVESYPVCDSSIFVEEYLVFGSGALGSDLHLLFLTDSNSFVKEMGYSDFPKKYLKYECNSKDSVIFWMFESRWMRFLESESIFVNIDSLKKSNVNDLLFFDVRKY